MTPTEDTTERDTMTTISISNPTIGTGPRPNFTTVRIGALTLYFSYQTVVCFEDNSTGDRGTTENYWGPTTGKHLNYCQPDKSRRLSADAFADELGAVLARHGLAV